MKDWLHFMLDELGRSEYEDANGNISSSVVPKALVNTPDGWKDISVGYDRDIKKIGLIKAFTFPLMFVLDGAKILRYFFYEFFLGFKLYYLITQRKVEFTPSDFKDYHTKWFRGQIDWTSFEDDEDKVTCKIGPYGLEKQLEAQKGTVFEFSLADALAENIELDGVRLYSTVNFEAPAQVEYDDAVFTHTHCVPFGYTTREGNTYGLAIFNQTIQSIPNAGVVGGVQQFLNTSSNYFAACDVASAPLSLTLKGKLVVNVTYRAIGASVKFNLRTNFGQNIQIPGSATQLNADTFIPVNITMTLQPGEHLFLIGTVFGLFSGGSIGFKYVFKEGSDVAISYDNIYHTTYCRGFNLWNLLNRMIEKISGKAGLVVSSLLQSTPYDEYFITCGDSIRGFHNAVVKIKFDDLFEIIKVNCFAGMSIQNGKLNIDRVNTYFLADPSPDSPIQLTVGTCTNSVAQEYLFSSIEIGHKDKDIKGLNGKYRFNTKHVYTIPREESKEKITLVSPAIADPYIFEYARINYDGKTTTDSDTDNELFLIHGENVVRNNLKALAEAPTSYPVTSGDAIHFQSFNNFGLVPDSALQRFTYMDLNPVNVNIELYCVPVTQPTAGQSVTIVVRKNGTDLATATVNADGINAALALANTTLNNGDYLECFITSSPPGSILIASASLSVIFGNLQINKLFRETYNRIEGVPDNSVFNVTLSPKRLLLLWKQYLNSISYKLDGKFYEYQTSDRNPELLTEKLGVIIDEDANEEITTDILFKPIYFETTTLVPIDLVDILDSKPNLPFSFNWLDASAKGFLMRGGIAPDDDRSQVFRLLCSSDTDEKQFKR